MSVIQWLLLVGIALLAGCAQGEVRNTAAATAAQLAPAPHPVATTMVYDCDSYVFVTRQGPGEMALWLPDRYLVLSQVPSGSGTKYQEGDVEFWSKGDEAMLTVDSQRYSGCRMMPERVPWEDARRRGVDFRAVGNEPGWYLEIQQGRQLLLVTDYGSTRLLAPDPGEQMQGHSRVYEAVTAAGQLRVEIIDEDCYDSMSGEEFPSQVTVGHDGKILYGCGRNLDHPWQ